MAAWIDPPNGLPLIPFTSRGDNNPELPEFLTASAVTGLLGHINEAREKLHKLALMSEKDQKKSFPDINHPIITTLAAFAEKLETASTRKEKSEEDISKLRIALARYTALLDVSTHAASKDVRAMAIKNWKDLQEKKEGLSSSQESLLTNLQNFMREDWAALRERLKPAGTIHNYLPLYLEANYFLFQYLSDQCAAAPNLVPQDIKSEIDTYRPYIIDQHAATKLSAIKSLCQSSHFEEKKFDTEVFSTLELLTDFANLTQEHLSLIGVSHRLWPIVSKILTLYDHTLGIIEKENRRNFERLALSANSDEDSRTDIPNLTLMVPSPSPDRIRAQLLPELERLKTRLQEIHNMIPPNTVPGTVPGTVNVSTAMPEFHRYMACLQDACDKLPPPPISAPFNGLAIFAEPPTDAPISLPTDQERLHQFLLHLNSFLLNAQAAAHLTDDPYLLVLSYKDRFVTPCKNARDFLAIIDSFPEDTRTKYREAQNNLLKLLDLMAPLEQKVSSFLKQNGFEQDPHSFEWTEGSISRLRRVLDFLNRDIFPH